MKNTLLMFAFLITVVGLTGCSSPTTPTPTDDMAVVEDNMDENMGDSDEAMDDEDMWDMDAEDANEWEEAAMWDDEAMEADVVIDISGENFFYSQETIEVTEGDVVTVNFTSDQWFHDWVVDEFDAATEKVETWGTTSVTFVADQVGEFEYYCSVGAHRANGMVGMLIVNAAE